MAFPLVDGTTGETTDVHAGMVVKRVRVATTAAGTLATSFENGDTVDGVVLATGNRILLKDQATGADNGIYTVNATGAPTRALDFDESAEVLPNTLVVVSEGTTNADTAWMLTTNATITLGTTALVFAQFGNSGSSTASGVRVYASADQAIGNGAYTAVAFPNETYDTDGYHDNATNNSRLTVPTGKDGKFSFKASVAFASSTTGARVIQIRKNGTIVSSVELNTTPSGVVSLSIADDLALVATDYVEVHVYQGSGGNLNLNGASSNVLVFAALNRIGD